MNVFRVWRDGTETFTLTVHDGASLKAIYATHTAIHRELDSSGSTHSEITYSIRLVGVRVFVERWVTDALYKSNRDRTGFRMPVALEVGNNAYHKFAETIRALRSDSDDVVEVYECIRQFVEDEAIKDEKEGR
ncbi:MAG: hypothetical protein KGI11_08460 [Thaumarchaeota archaeon]|nr:hypothetical protein [Nitrososphaerota archaeon]